MPVATAAAPTPMTAQNHARFASGRRGRGALAATKLLLSDGDVDVVDGLTGAAVDGAAGLGGGASCSLR